MRVRGAARDVCLHEAPRGHRKSVGVGRGDSSGLRDENSTWKEEWYMQRPRDMDLWGTGDSRVTGTGDSRVTGTGDSRLTGSVPRGNGIDMATEQGRANSGGLYLPPWGV